MEFKTLSAGQTTLSPRAWFLQKYLSEAYNTEVAVPAQIHNYMFIFSIQQEMVEQQILQGKSKTTIDQLLRILSKFDAALPDEELAELLRNSQVALQVRKDDVEDAEDELAEYMKMARTLKRTISTEVMKSGISNIVLADVLTSDARTLPLKDLGQFDFGTLADAMGLIQNYYNQYVESVSTDELNTFASGNMWSNNALGFTRNLYRLMHRETGPSMTARLSYVVDTIFQKVFDAPFLDATPVREGLVYEVHPSTENFIDLNYAESYGAYLLLKRTIEGYKVSGLERASIMDMVKSSVFHTADRPDVLPTELGAIDYDKVKAYCVKRWLYYVIKRVSTSDFGTMVGRIDSISDLRKYKRSDAVDNNLREANTVASILWDSFLDVGAELKHLIMNPNIYYPDVKPYDRKMFSELFWNQMTPYATFRFGIDSGRFIFEPAIMINHSYNESSSIGIEWIVGDTDHTLSGHMYDPDFRVRQFKKGRIHAGSIEFGKFASGTDLRTLRLAENFEPIYMMRITRPALLKMDAFKASSELMSLGELKKTNMSRFLLQHAELVTYLSAEEISVMQRIPLSLAKMIFDRHSSLYARFSSLLPIFFIWKPTSAPVFEVSLPDDKNFKSFVTSWPYLITRSLYNGDPIYANTGGVTLTVQNTDGSTKKVDMKTDLKQTKDAAGQNDEAGDAQKGLGFSKDSE